MQATDTLRAEVRAEVIRSFPRIHIYGCCRLFPLARTFEYTFISRYSVPYLRRSNSILDCVGGWYLADDAVEVMLRDPGPGLEVHVM